MEDLLFVCRWKYTFQKSKKWTVPKLKETIKAILEKVVEKKLRKALHSVFSNMAAEFGFVIEDNSNKMEIIETIIQFS